MILKLKYKIVFTQFGMPKNSDSIVGWFKEGHLTIEEVDFKSDYENTASRILAQKRLLALLEVNNGVNNKPIGIDDGETIIDTEHRNFKDNLKDKWLYECGLSSEIVKYLRNKKINIILE
jgi:hypothetical protein